MIAGSISFSSDSGVSSVLSSLREYMIADAVTWHDVSAGCFNGGFFLSSRLPYTVSERYYSDKERDILVLLSGSIYNTAELTALVNIGSPVPVPELLATLFIREGPGFVKRLNGDFALLIWRPSVKQAFLFRDQAGISPIAYSLNDQTFIFSSDIIGLCRALSGDNAIDTEYLMTYFKYTDRRRTPDESVKKLLPGHYLRFSEEGAEMIKYWHPEKIKEDNSLGYDMMLADLKELVRDAVKIRCDSRFNAGAHVTGGLDSGIVSVLAHEEYSHQEIFPGFSWSPAHFVTENVKYDERIIIERFCEATNIQPVYSDLDEKSFPQVVSGYLYNQGYFPEDRTSAQAAAKGINLVFSGWGGDEFISTGDRGIETDLLRHFRWRTFFRRNPVRNPRKFIRYFLLYVAYPALGILDRDTRESFRDEALYIRRPFKKSDRQALRNYYFHTSRRHVHLGVFRFYHLQERCESWAVNGFRKGIEYRYPLLDKRIIEYMLKVPSELLCKTKHFRPLLRIISERVLPEEVRWQYQKSDPVCWSYMDEMFKKSSYRFMEEVSRWKENQDLHFIDFDRLEQDIRKQKAHSEDIDSKVLFRALVYIKAVHEFTAEYRGGGDP